VGSTASSDGAAPARCFDERSRVKVDDLRRGRGRVKRTLWPALIVVTLVGVAAFDFFTGAALVGAILFTLPLALCATQGSKPVLWCTAVAAVSLTLVPELWGDHQIHLVSLLNRVLLVASLLTLTTYIHLSIGKTRSLIEHAAKIDQQRGSLRAQNAQLELLVTAAAHDLEVRKQTEEHVTDLEGRYRGLLEAAPDAMVVVNESGTIVLLNLQAEKQFGYSLDELAGQPVTSIIAEGFANA
jgi:PAS domain-containing protein